jgi:SAM-dependent methyltransferase
VRERRYTPLRIPEIFDRLRAEIEQAPLAHKDWHRTNLERHRGRYIADLEQLAAVAPKGSVVLEVGAAPCHFTAGLAEAGYAVKAVDLDPRRIADFATRFGIEIAACDIESEPLPFADGSFPYVVCAETYEHLRRDPFFALSEINRVMTSGGLLLLSTPNLYSAQNIARFLAGRSIADPLAEFGKLRTIGHMGHVREYSNREMRRILAAHGFDVIGTRYGHYYYPPTRRGRAARLVFALLPRRYRTFQSIVARKERPGPGLRPLPA